MEGRASSRRGVLLFLLVGVASANPDGEIRFRKLLLLPCLRVLCVTCTLPLVRIDGLALRLCIQLLSPCMYY